MESSSDHKRLAYCSQRVTSACLCALIPDHRSVFEIESCGGKHGVPRLPSSRGGCVCRLPQTTYMQIITWTFLHLLSSRCSPGKFHTKKNESLFYSFVSSFGLDGLVWVTYESVRLPPRSEHSENWWNPWERWNEKKTKVVSELSSSQPGLVFWFCPDIYRNLNSFQGKGVCWIWK